MPVSKNVSSKLTASDLFNIQFVGTALPGTNREQRQRDIVASAALSRRKFTNISSAGGFTILGKNAFGQDVARDNVTGNVRTVNSFNPITPESRGIGSQKTPNTLSAQANTRRRDRGRGSNSTSTGRKAKSNQVLGTSSILGTQSILG